MAMKEKMTMASGIGMAVVWCVAASAAEAPKITQDWPQYMGSNGSLSSVTPGVVLSIDPSKYRLLWTSEEKDMGRGKTHSGYPNVNYDPQSLPGGLASPILAGGLVYLHYFRPKPGAMVKLDPEMTDHPHYRILADDVDVAIEAATGRTLWRQVGAEPGLNLYTSKRGGWGVTGCVREGRYFAMDTLGQVHAYDARTGKRLWSAGDGARGRSAREQALTDRRFAKRDELCLRGHLSTIGGRLIAPQYGHSLIALDPATGKERWTWTGDIAPFAEAAFRVGTGRDLALVPGGKGVTCLDPANGTVLWHLDGPGQDFLSTWQDVFLFVDTGKEAFDKEVGGAKGVTNARWALYRARPERPELVWRSTVMTVVGSDGGPQRRAPIDGTLAYLPGTLETTPPITQYTDCTAVDLATGAVICHRKRESSSAGMWVGVRWDNLLISRCEADNAGVRCMREADPKKLDAFQIWKALGHFHYGYQTVTLDAYGDGIAYVRHLDHGGCIQAWDLKGK
jgi:outer membrane protein assembly factor BamB